ncbi:hypothetical protein E2C01_009844 [Portunus trituberculatus]|uniref:Uncharacterized protein n=1 Tax=Portunus trituberculatus TaxID=210409 RepID=A0A5B7D6U2_PORTR|nr:hypothetical protein [Portunus trituberculatus]
MADSSLSPRSKDLERTSVSEPSGHEGARRVGVGGRFAAVDGVHEGSKRAPSHSVRDCEWTKDTIEIPDDEGVRVRVDPLMTGQRGETRALEAGQAPAPWDEGPLHWPANLRPGARAKVSPEITRESNMRRANTNTQYRETKRYRRAMGHFGHNLLEINLPEQKAAGGKGGRKRRQDGAPGHLPQINYRP